MTTVWPTGSGSIATRGCASATATRSLGYNFRLTDLAAAIGLCQLDKLERNTARRQAIAARYDAAFADLPIRTPVIPAGRTHVFHQYTIAVGDDRDGIVADLAAAGVGTGIYYPIPVHRQPYVAGARDRRRPAGHRSGVRADAVAADVSRRLAEEEQATVIAAVRTTVERRAPGTPAEPLAAAPEGASR